MLKKIRRVSALVFFIAITLLFLDFTGVIHLYLGWMAKIQFLPALLAGNLAVVLVIAAVTLIFGRVYCSVVCPLGVMQDLFGWLGLRAKRNRYGFSKEKKALRYGMLTLFAIALLAGVASFVALLAPYSSYGRIVTNLFAPVYEGFNNILAYFAARGESYAFYHKEIVFKGLGTFVVASLSFVAIAFLSYRNGRTYCNTVCPVGTVLSFLARVSLFRPVIDTAKCVNCTACGKRCKAACIDTKNHRIDYTRCVACMDCIENCTAGAISYKFVKPAKKSAARADSAEHPSEESQPKAVVNDAPADLSRRKYLLMKETQAVAGVVKEQEKDEDGWLAAIVDKQIPERQTEIVPPGAGSIRNLTQHCTGCQLCISKCPNDVLRPSGNIMTLMQPRSSYERGFCRPECTACADVCPAGAIRKITVEEKSSIQIGHAVWDGGLCLPMAEGVHCGNCARHCPSGAITMVSVDPDNEDSPEFPVVDENRCIGCGECEYVCPVRPLSAIYVEGHEVHKTI